MRIINRCRELRSSARKRQKNPIGKGRRGGNLSRQKEKGSQKKRWGPKRGDSHEVTDARGNAAVVEDQPEKKEGGVKIQQKNSQRSKGGGGEDPC